jgi:hypothetical protein
VEPQELDIFRQPAAIDLLAAAADTDGRVVRVEFYANGQRLGASTNAPFAYRWEAPAPGVYAVSALAVDDSGAIGQSRTATIAVQSVRIAAPTSPVADGQFRLRFDADDGRRYRVQSSTNLVDWIDAGVVSGYRGLAEFAEPAATELRFYRVVPGP